MSANEVTLRQRVETAIETAITAVAGADFVVEGRHVITVRLSPQAAADLAAHLAAGHTREG